MKKAKIFIEEGKPSGPIVCRFNPSELSFNSGQPNWKENEAQSQEPTKLQFQNRGADELSMQLFFDTSEEQADVREKYTKRLTYLTRPEEKGEKPPPTVKFVWGGFSFKSVVTSLSHTFTMFLPDGTPVRAKSDVTFQRIEPPKAKGGGSGKSKSGGSYTLSKGETLAMVAADQLGSPAYWTKIASANGIENPRDVEAGTTLTIPSP